MSKYKYKLYTVYNNKNNILFIIYIFTSNFFKIKKPPISNKMQLHNYCIIKYDLNLLYLIPCNFFLISSYIVYVNSYCYFILTNLIIYLVHDQNK